MLMLLMRYPSKLIAKKVDVSTIVSDC